MKKEIYEIPGTVAYAITQNMDKINASATNLYSLRETVKGILTDPANNIKDQKEVDTLVKGMDQMRNVNHLLSSIGTWMTGIKTVQVGTQFGRDPSGRRD